MRAFVLTLCAAGIFAASLEAGATVESGGQTSLDAAFLQNLVEAVNAQERDNTLLIPPSAIEDISGGSATTSEWAFLPSYESTYIILAHTNSLTNVVNESALSDYTAATEADYVEATNQIAAHWDFVNDVSTIFVEDQSANGMIIIWSKNLINATRRVYSGLDANGNYLELYQNNSTNMRWGTFDDQTITPQAFGISNNVWTPYISIYNSDGVVSNWFGSERYAGSQSGLTVNDATTNTMGWGMRYDGLKPFRGCIGWWGAWNVAGSIDDAMDVVWHTATTNNPTGNGYGWDPYFYNFTAKTTTNNWTNLVYASLFSRDNGGPDFSTNRNHGADPGGAFSPTHVTVTNNAGEDVGAAYDYDGGDYLDVSAILDLGVTNATTGSFEFWIRQDTLTGAQVWFGITDSGDADRQMLLYWEPGGAEVYWYCRGDRGGYNNGPFGNNPYAGISVDTWHHMMLVQDGTKPALYIDGVRWVFTDNKGNHADDTFWLHDIDDLDAATLGARNISSAFSLFYNGEIDDFMYYDKALTPLECTNRYNAVSNTHQN